MLLCFHPSVRRPSPSCSLEKDPIQRLPTVRTTDTTSLLRLLLLLLLFLVPDNDEPIPHSIAVRDAPSPW